MTPRKPLEIKPLPYLTVGQVAKVFGVHRQTIYRWIDDGHLVPSFRAENGTLVFSREYIEALRHADPEAEETEAATGSGAVAG